MKRIGFLICAIFIGTAYAETFTMTWLNEDRTTTYDTTTCEAGDDITLPTAPTKRGYTFMGWTKYIQIEYIGGYSNVQYIDTGIVPTSDMKIYTKVQYIGDDTCSVIGARQQGYYGAAIFIDPDQMNIDWFGTNGNNRWSPRNIATTNDIYEYNIENSNIQVTKNNTVIGTHQFSPTGSTSYSLFVGAVNNAGQPNSNTSCNLRIYAFQIWQNGTLVRDMIPVKDLNNVPCMYDKVNDQFYYNAGTGTFTAGPETYE